MNAIFLCRMKCHATKFLPQNNFKVLEWPENSSDLNSIEKVWTEVKNKVSKRQPSSAPELARVIKEDRVREILKNPKFNRQYAKTHGSYNQE